MMALAHVGRLTSLKELNLDTVFARFTDKGMVHLKRLKNLRSLSLFQSDITGAGFAELRGLDHLERLVLKSDRAVGP